MGSRETPNNVIFQFFFVAILVTLLHNETNGQERNNETTKATEMTRNPISTSLDTTTNIPHNMADSSSSERPNDQGQDDPTSFVNDENHEVPDDDSPLPFDYNSSVFRESEASTKPFSDEYDNSNEDSNDTNYYYYDYDYSDHHYGEMKQISFTKTLYFCEYLFSAMFGQYESFPESGLVHNNKTVTVIHEERFLNICKPFYTSYNNCSDRGEITFCHEENVLLLNEHGCQKPSAEDVHFEHLLAATLLENDEECFQSVCSGNTRVIDQVVNGNYIRLIHPDEMNTKVQCQRYLHHYYFLNNSLEVYIMKNTYWPCCYPTYSFLLSQDQQNQSILNSWTYLSSRCHVSEAFVLTIIGIATTNSVVSNFVVIFVLLSKGCLSKDMKLLNASLGISDFSLSIFVMVPAFIKHIMLMHENENIKLLSNEEDIIQYFEMEYSDLKTMPEIKSGYYLFSAMIMSLCSLNSLYTLSALAFEKFFSTSRLCKEKNCFPQSKIKIFIGASWVVSLLLTFGLMHDPPGISSEVYSFAKLPTGVSNKGKKTVLPLVMVLLGLVSLFTLISSCLAIYYYSKLQKEESQQRTEGNDRHTRKSNVTVTMTMMAISFTISVISGGMGISIYVAGVSFQNTEILSYCWWIFLFSTSWNPWLYNLSDKRFRGDVTQTFTAAVSTICWGRSWVPSEDNSNQSHGDQKDSANSDSNNSFKRKSVRDEEILVYREESV